MSSIILKTDMNDVLGGTGNVLVSRPIFLISFPSNQGSAFVSQGIRESYHLLFPAKGRVLSTSSASPLSKMFGSMRLKISTLHCQTSLWLLTLMRSILITPVYPSVVCKSLDISGHSYLFTFCRNWCTIRVQKWQSPIFEEIWSLRKFGTGPF